MLCLNSNYYHKDFNDNNNKKKICFENISMALPRAFYLQAKPEEEMVSLSKKKKKYSLTSYLTKKEKNNIFVYFLVQTLKLTCQVNK